MENITMDEPISADDNRKKLNKIQENNSKMVKDIADANILVSYCEDDDLPQPEISSSEFGINLFWNLDWTITISRDKDDWVDFFAYCGDDSQTIHCKFLTIVYAYRLLKLFILHICYDE